MTQWKWNGKKRGRKIQLTFNRSDIPLSSFLFLTSLTGLYEDTYFHSRDEETERFYDLQKLDKDEIFTLIYFTPNYMLFPSGRLKVAFLSIASRKDKAQNESSILMIPVFVSTQGSTNCYVCGSQTIAIIQLTQLYIYFEVDNGIPGNSTFPLHMVPCPQTMSPKAMSCFCCLRDSGPIFPPSWMCIDAHSTLSSSRECHTPSLLNFKCFQLVFKIQRSYAKSSLVLI